MAENETAAGANRTYDDPIPPKRIPTRPPGQHPRTLIVVPTKEERENLDWVFERFQDLDDPDLHILIADDDSIDKTWSRAGTWAADDARMHLLRRPGRFKGRGFALRESYKWAAESEFGYEYVLECAANGTDDILQVPKLIAALDAGADVVVGARSVSEGGDDASPRRRQGLACFCTGAPVDDVESGFRGFKMAALRQIARRLKAPDHRIKAEALAAAKNAGLKVVQVPVPYVSKTHDGRPKKGGDSGAGALLGLWLRRITKRV
ncbi:MAG: glycosyltransferase family 2 protein [Planctomycetes bacterium]|nr:glycosyltransferase family 2 protein [Planctomycetota bacterium]